MDTLKQALYLCHDTPMENETLYALAEEGRAIHRTATDLGLVMAGSTPTDSGVSQFMLAGAPDWLVGMCKSARNYNVPEGEYFHDVLWQHSTTEDQTWVEIELPEVCNSWPFNDDYPYDVWANQLNYEIVQWENCTIPQMLANG